MIERRSTSKVANAPYRFPGVTAYWKHLQNEDPDVVIVRGVTRWFCRIAAICAIGQGRRLVIYDQEDAAPSAWGSTWIRRAVFKYLGIPHVTSRLSSTDSRLASGNALSLPFGSPFEPTRAAELGRRLLQWPPRILMVAKYRERKGHSALLKALSIIPKSMSFSLTFCGEEVTPSDTAFRRTLLQEARALGIADRLKFRNNVAHDNMDSVFSSHDLLILPSLFEPAAVSPIEAAWAGCAVLMSRDSGTRGYIPEGDAYDFLADDPEDIARAIAGVLAQPESLRQARDSCFSHISAVANDGAILRLFEHLAGFETRRSQ
ncbi:glycosyltransferase family 4 protein [Mesorhizobium sp.]|uniref:glycosyltransferase family 4 protein n=1 Tax=Mesorhizobium sp. TaxID=1871066 RepID=UPI000FE91B35|nr:MAG: glycosyltransferase [Mesorhizobium sp.]